MSEIETPSVGIVEVNNPADIAVQIQHFLKTNHVSEVQAVIPLTMAVPRKIAAFAPVGTQPEIDYVFTFVIIYL